MINFNQPHLTGKEAHYMYEAVFAGKLSGNGKFTKDALNSGVYTAELVAGEAVYVIPYNA